MTSWLNCMSSVEVIPSETSDFLQNRSVLASLKPLGAGTPFREILSSYFMRLSDQHSLSPKVVAREFVLPLLGLSKGLRENQADRFWRTSFFNGMDRVAAEWVQALSQLTGVKELRHLTLLPLHGVVARHGSASLVRRWCPRCLLDGEEEGKPYGQLLWEIGVVKACPLHEVRLVHACGCLEAEKLSTLKVKHLPHLCGSCGRSLARSEEAPLEAATAEELRFARRVAALVGSPFFEGEDKGLRGVGFQRLIREAVHPELAGSGVALAKAVGVGPSTVSGWLNGDHIPSLSQVFATAELLNLTMDEVLTGRGSVKLIVRRDLAQKKKETQKAPGSTWSSRALRDAMELIAKAEPPLSLAEVARVLGTSPRELYRRENNLSRLITQRAVLARTKGAIEAREQRVERVRTILAQIAKEGLYPSRRRIEERMGGSRVFLLNEDFKQVMNPALSQEG